MSLTAAMARAVVEQADRHCLELCAEEDAAAFDGHIVSVLRIRELKQAARLLAESEASELPVLTAPENHGRLHPRDLVRMFGGHL